MKVIIAGGRDIFDRDAVYNAIWASKLDITEVVCGGASGVDTLGAEWATSHGIAVKVFKADWAKYGNPAGPIRNREMAEYADALILVWDGKSRGSASMKQIAKEKGLVIFESIIVA